MAAAGRTTPKPWCIATIGSAPLRASLGVDGVRVDEAACGWNLLRSGRGHVHDGWRRRRQDADGGDLRPGNRTCEWVEEPSTSAIHGLTIHRLLPPMGRGTGDWSPGDTARIRVCKAPRGVDLRQGRGLLDHGWRLAGKAQVRLLDRPIRLDLIGRSGSDYAAVFEDIDEVRKPQALPHA